MRKQFLSLLLAFSLFTAGTLTSTNSEAAIGLLFKQRAIISFGSIAAKTGGVAIGAGIVGLPVLCAIECTGLPLLSGFSILFGGYAALFGLVILDDNTVMSLNYLPIDENHPDYKKYGAEMIEVYNSEVEELNAIKDTLEEELEFSKYPIKEGVTLWEEYSNYLSPETVEIAQDQAARLFKK